MSSCSISSECHTPLLNKRAWLQEVVLSEQSRAREEAEKRLNKLMKNLDHLERARREEEAPLLEANHTKQARAQGSRLCGIGTRPGMRGTGRRGRPICGREVVVRCQSGHAV